MAALLVLIPFLSVLILNLPFRDFNRRACFGAAAVLFLLQMGSVFVPDNSLWNADQWGIGAFFNFGFKADILSKVVLFCIGLVSLVTLFTCRHFFKEANRRFNFINLLLIAAAGMNAISLAQDIFSLYVFLEVTAVASFILIAFDRDILGLEGAFKYIVLSGVATVLMIAAIALLVFSAGSANFSAIHAGLLLKPNPLVINLALGLFITALLIKSGLMPFHGWLPDAYTAAPAPASVFLAGAVTKVAGIYTLIRILTSVPGFANASRDVLLFVGAFSAILAALAALTQSDFKRMLSYSSISQVGYIILGVGSGTALGLAGATLHIFNHAVFKSLLFINGAAVESQTGSRDIDKMSGLSRRMPWTGLTSILGSLSCAGIPPLAGFWSKLVIIIALWLAGYKVYAVIAILGSLLTLAYFLALQRKAFFGKLGDEFQQVKEAGVDLIFPALLLGGLIVGVGVLTPFVLDKFIKQF
ncbi:MAG: proton-conducting transporter membrane subunit [Candidatus Omnitrophota bacterium]